MSASKLNSAAPSARATSSRHTVEAQICGNGFLKFVDCFWYYSIWRVTHGRRAAAPRCSCTCLAFIKAIFAVDDKGGLTGSDASSRKRHAATTPPAKFGVDYSMRAHNAPHSEINSMGFRQAARQGLTLLAAAPGSFCNLLISTRGFRVRKLRLGSSSIGHVLQQSAVHSWL